MGNTKIRKLLEKERRWNDKNAPKHKHSFTVHAIVQLTDGKDSVSYYDVMKCEHCNSFEAIPKEKNNLGLITDNNIDKSLPIIKLKKPQKWIIGFANAELNSE